MTTALYFLLALAWLMLAAIRGAYLRGQETLRDNWELFAFVVVWGVVAGLMWPLALPFCAGWWLRENR